MQTLFLASLVFILSTVLSLPLDLRPDDEVKQVREGEMAPLLLEMSPSKRGLDEWEQDRHVKLAEPRSSQQVAITIGGEAEKEEDRKQEAQVSSGRLAKHHAQRALLNGVGAVTGVVAYPAMGIAGAAIHTGKSIVHLAKGHKRQARDELYSAGTKLGLGMAAPLVTVPLFSYHAGKQGVKAVGHAAHSAMAWVREEDSNVRMDPKLLKKKTMMNSNLLKKKQKETGNFILRYPWELARKKIRGDLPVQGEKEEKDLAESARSRKDERVESSKPAEQNESEDEVHPSRLEPSSSLSSTPSSPSASSPLSSHSSSSSVHFSPPLFWHSSPPPRSTRSRPHEPEPEPYPRWSLRSTSPTGPASPLIPHTHVDKPHRSRVERWHG